MKIGILYICTGNYKIFWKDFYLSCEKYFLPTAEKEYFVFTDAPEIDFEKENSHIHKIYQENLGWPGNTLQRYEIFLKQKNILKRFDYLFYLNANLLMVKQINAEDFLPEKNKSLVAVIHPGYYNKPSSKFTYEKNPNSTAYLSDGKNYFAGGINGGRTNEFISAMEKMNLNIKQDQASGILAVWHDESHWNRLLSDRDDIKILNPSFLFPEGSDLPFEKIILIRDKKMAGGHANLRQRRELRLIINEVKSYINKIILVFRLPLIIGVRGGLGNQMFIYAFGRAKEFGGSRVWFDLSFYYGARDAGDTARLYKLDKFNLQTKARFIRKNSLLLKIFNKILIKLGKSGYYQSEKYFSAIAPVIKKEFSLKDNLSHSAIEIMKKIKSSESISVHIRRGDYVTNSNANAFHGVCGLEYYKSAMEFIVKKVSDPIYFVFSDDIEWARQNFVGPQYVFVSNPEILDYEEMQLQALCKHNIIANSSFSWWGAWLNNNPQKIVIAPKQWFANTNLESNDIVPENWIKL